MAATPSPPGIRRSISTTSGGSARAAATASAPEAASPTTVEVGLGVEHAAQPGPHDRMVVDEQHPDHAGTSSPMVVPRARAAGDVQPCRDLLGPGPHARAARTRPAAACRRRSRAPSSVTVSRTASGRRRPARTVDRRAPACLRTLVSASCAARSSTTSIAVGSGAASPVDGAAARRSPVSSANRAACRPTRRPGRRSQVGGRQRRDQRPGLGAGSPGRCGRPARGAGAPLGRASAPRRPPAAA